MFSKSATLELLLPAILILAGESNDLSLFLTDRAATSVVWDLLKAALRLLRLDFDFLVGVEMMSRGDSSGHFHDLIKLITTTIHSAEK